MSYGNITRSSTFTIAKVNDFNPTFIIRWMVAGAFIRPKCITPN